MAGLLGGKKGVSEMGITLVNHEGEPYAAKNTVAVSFSWTPSVRFWDLCQVEFPGRMDFCRRVAHDETGRPNSDRDVMSIIGAHLAMWNYSKAAQLGDIPELFHSGFTGLETFLRGAGATEAAKAARSLKNWCASCNSGKRPMTGWWISGPLGTGKTGLARAVQVLLRTEFPQVSTAWYRSADLFSALKSAYGRDAGERREHGDSENLIYSATHPDILFLDDLGAGGMSTHDLDILYRIIDARYQARKPLLVTSNYSLTDLRERSKTDSGRRIMDRLTDLCIELSVGGKSLRRQPTTPEDEERDSI